MLNIKKILHFNLFELFKKNTLTHYRIIIKLKLISKNLMKIFNNSNQCEITHTMENLNVICLICSHKFLSSLIEHPEIEFICLDPEVFLCGNKSFSDIEITNPKQIRYNSKLTGKNITVAIIDSGIYPLDIFTKPKNRIRLFRDLINNYKYPYDDNGHGTAMSCIIGSNFIYKNSILKSASECDLCIIKTFNKFNKSFCSLIFKALDIICENSSTLNVQLLCLPFELYEFNEFILNIFQSLFNKISKKNILITIPIGNNSNNYTSLKGLSLLNNCIVIGGLNLNESSRGISTKNLLKPTTLSIFENIYIPNINYKYVPEKNNQYIYPPKLKNLLIEYYGTSCSCSYVCGILTILKEKKPSLNVNDVLSLLKLCCNKLENTDTSLQGLGILNMDLLLE